MAPNDINPNQFPPNSHKYHEMKAKEKEPEKEKKITKKIKGKATFEKKPLSKKFAEAFVAEDFGSVIKYLLSELLIPELKSMFVDALYEGFGMFLGVNKKKPSSGGTTNYAKPPTYYNYGNVSNRRNDVVDSNTGNDYRNIIFEQKADAASVLSDLQELAEEYDQVSVADLYELAGVSGSSFTDNKYGWIPDMLTKDQVGIRRVREGFLIVLPKAINIE